MLLLSCFSLCLSAGLCGAGSCSHPRQAVQPCPAVSAAGWESTTACLGAFWEHNLERHKARGQLSGLHYKGALIDVMKPIIEAVGLMLFKYFCWDSLQAL